VAIFLALIGRHREGIGSRLNTIEYLRHASRLIHFEGVGMREQSPPWPKAGPASYFPSIEKKYGRSIGEWQDIIGKSGLDKHMAIVSFLKSEYQMMASHLYLGPRESH
jgi:Domain of unknown function (DUF4287)